MAKKFDNVPVNACLLRGEFHFVEDEGESDNMPITMLARSAKAIDHWYWGRVVHDFSGMKVHKDVLTIDYNHGDPIGYLNQFDDRGKEGLFVSGELVPTGQPGDRVPILSALKKGGVPFEASINFDGDEIRYESIGEGQVVEVNGLEFEGPGVVIREWSLRGVAVCPYGADADTESQFIRNETLTTFKEGDVPKNEKEGKAELTAETQGTESSETDTMQAEEVAANDSDAASELSAGQQEAQRFVNAFGDKGAVWFAEGKSFEEARSLQLSGLQASNEKLSEEVVGLKKKLALPGKDGEDEAVEFTSGKDGGKKSSDAVSLTEALFSKRG